MQKLQPRVVSFGEQCAIIRENLAELCEKDEEWSDAARVLGGIDFESGMRQVDDQYKLGKYIKIAMLYLEDSDHINAEVYIKKSASLIGNCPDDALQLQYKMCYARILDAKRRFLEVAMRYYELSSLDKMEFGGKRVKEEDLEMALLASIKCTVLASAGPQRSRMLATLYKDERTSQLSVFPFLEKVFKERILQKEEVEQFASTLDPHQLARLPDGSTVLDRAVLQHNILSASKLYLNASIDQLALLLGVDPEKAETAAADMISEGRLKGSIDQVKGFIYFDSEINQLEEWDQQIQSACQSVNLIMDLIEKKELEIGMASSSDQAIAGPSNC